MARKLAPSEFNTFVAGLNTEASPLTFPDNTSLDEVNFVLNKNGSRNRRLGMDAENSYTEVTTSIALPTTLDIALNTYKWNNVSGDAEKSILVVQIGNQLDFFDMDESPLSSGKIHTSTFSTTLVNVYFSFAVVDGILVCTTSEKDIYTFEFEEPSTITESTTYITTRDLFGVEDLDGTTNLRSGNGVEIRPTSLTDEHTYNLRNQTFAEPRINGNTETTGDPVDIFYTKSGNAKYPSNSDSVVEVLYPDAGDGDSRTIDRFFADNLINSPLGTTPAPMGHFIIDALERGTSRLAEEEALRDKYSEIGNAVNTLPLDKTPGGPTIVSEFAGRAWFGGFSGEIIDGDSFSPRLSSYLFFSQLVKSVNDITLCYQQGDPTSPKEPDIIDTDGGFVRLDGAYGLQSAHNVSTSLIVIANNGVWAVSGGGDEGFKATNYIVNKISDYGGSSPNSVVVGGDSLFFWGDNAIFHVHKDQFGQWVSENISEKSIKTLYNNISYNEKVTCKGHFDNIERKIHWVYGEGINSTANSKELVLDVNIGSFNKHEVYTIDGEFPRIVDLFETDPYITTSGGESVYIGSDIIQASAEDVIISTSTSTSTVKETVYLAILGVSPYISYTFSTYSNDGFLDWESIDSVGVDAAAYLVTGYLTAGDNQRDKQVMYMTAHFKRTENGWELSGDQIIPANQSSCKVQAQWEWANHANSGRWGTEFQAYRYRRLYIPEDVNDDYDYGFTTIITKNKLRGKGKALSLKFSTEAGKDCHLYGWSLIIAVEENV